MGDHTESLQVDFDPAQISFEQIVNLFCQKHSPTSPPRSRQYMSAIWHDGNSQREVIYSAREKLAEQSLGRIQTPVMSLDTFYLAEDYHQKYRLQRNAKLMDRFSLIYPRFVDFVNSTAAARLNGNALEQALTMSPEQLMQYGVLAELMREQTTGRTGADSSCRI
jgi:peptide-methionine (S)-S-oxide reductase